MAYENKSVLKPCPFCGSKMKLIQNREYKRLEVRHVNRGDDCPMYKTWLYDTEEAAVEAWNRRWHYKNS